MTSADEPSLFRAAADSPAGGAAFDAVIFDMDGVITRTAAVHSRAWKEMFDDYLRRHAAREGGAFREFTHEGDYLRYVDGRPRYQGVEQFLLSRGIVLPHGAAGDASAAETICGLGNRKNELFNAILARDGAGLYDSTIALIAQLRAAGRAVGLATSSRNSALVLEKVGVASLFATVVDGLVSEKLGLKGKPAPDIFTTASANLGVLPARAVVVEDAVSGVQAGAQGGFALVVGVARENNHAELRRAGADVVFTDLAETSLPQLDRLVQVKREGRK